MLLRVIAGENAINFRFQWGGLVKVGWPLLKLIDSVERERVERRIEVPGRLLGRLSAGDLGGIEMPSFDFETSFIGVRDDVHWQGDWSAAMLLKWEFKEEVASEVAEFPGDKRGEWSIGVVEFCEGDSGESLAGRAKWLTVNAFRALMAEEVGKAITEGRVNDVPSDHMPRHGTQAWYELFNRTAQR